MPTVKLAKLTPLHLEVFYRTLLERGGLRSKPLSPRTVQRVHRVLRKALRDAERKGILPNNPPGFLRYAPWDSNPEPAD